MSFEETNNSRTFTLTTGPTVDDPAWLYAGWEDVIVNERGGVVYREYVPFTDYSVVKDYIRKCEDERIANAARCKELNRICESFGMTYPELVGLAAQIKGGRSGRIVQK